MNADLNLWSVVLLGDWNPRILTPGWLAHNVFSDPEALAAGDNPQIDIEFPLQSGHPYRYTAGAIRITPAMNRVTFTPLENTDEVLREMEREIIALLGVLPHTPLKALGVNFAYLERHPEPEVISLFDAGDIPMHIAAGHTVGERWLFREIPLENRLLKLTLVLSGNEMKAQLNFHRAVDSCVMAVERVRDTVVADRQFGENLLHTIYDLELEADIE